MEDLSRYLLEKTTHQTHDAFMAISALVESFGMDAHVELVYSILSYEDQLDDEEVILRLQGIYLDSTKAILLSHGIDASPASLTQAYAILYALQRLANMDDPTQALSIMEGSLNNEDMFCELVAYINGDMAEDYLENIDRVDESFIQTLTELLTEVKDEDDHDGEIERVEKVPEIRAVLEPYLTAIEDTVAIRSVCEDNMPLALPPEVLVNELRDKILELDPGRWGIEFYALGIISTLAADDVREWTLKQITSYTDDPKVTIKAQADINRLLTGDLA